MRAFKYRIAIAITVASCVYAMFLVGCQHKTTAYKEIRVGAWSTSSPKEQGGLKLIAIQQDTPPGLEAWDKSSALIEGPCQLVWIEGLDPMLEDRPMKRRQLAFALEGKNGHSEAIDSWTMSEKKIILSVPLYYGPNHQNGTLKGYRDGKLIASWKLSGMEPVTQRIADSEPNITEFKAFGYAFKLKEPARCKRTSMNRFPEVTFSVAQADFSCNELEPGKTSKDPIEVEIDPIRSTWFEKENNGHPRLQVDPKRLLGLYFMIPFLEIGDRVEYETRFRQYRTYRETIVLRNVGVEPDFTYDGNDHSTKTYFTTSGRLLPVKPYTLTTPSGLKLTIGPQVERTYLPEYPLAVRIACSQGIKNIKWEGSPLYRGTRKPFALSAGIVVNGVFKTAGGWGEGKDKDKGTEYIDVHLPYPGKRPTKPTVIPELKLVIIQKAILEEKTVTVRFPVEADTPQTKKTK